MVINICCYNYLYTSHHLCYFVAVTIGFERPRYIISEPGSGTTTIEVCMVLTVGSLGQRVVIEPQWVPDSAEGRNLMIITGLDNC